MKNYSLSICLICATFFGFSNNVIVENVSLTNQNVSTNVKDIEFDISWENSWRTSASPSNWDACWVFAKYRITNETTWHHVTLSSTDGDHAAPSGSTIDAVSDGKGVFIFRSADGFGNNDWNDVRINWQYGTDGLADADSVEICVFAIEMVNIPDGDFDLGDGDGSTVSLRALESASNDNTRVRITSGLSELIESDNTTAYDDAQLGTTGLYLNGSSGIDLNGDGDFLDAGDNADFPVGYSEVYCMKYEITQGQFVEFANKLTETQAANIIGTAYTDGQNINGSGNVWSSTTPDVAKALGSYELAAYLDWAALRPMTETEFEKICRGPITAVPDEYAWGNTDLHGSSYTVLYRGTYQEIISNAGTNTGNANSQDGGVSRALRVGIFAASSTNHTREETGATYYGVMEMSGNLGEIVVCLCDPDGRSFDGSHGDGDVHLTGYANMSGWPNYDGTDNHTNDGGFAVRGGRYSASTSFMQVSERSEITLHPTTAGSVFGGRGLRTP